MDEDSRFPKLPHVDTLLGSSVQLWYSPGRGDGFEEGRGDDFRENDGCFDHLLYGLHAILDGSDTKELSTVWLSLCQLVLAIRYGFTLIFDAVFTALI